MKAFYGKDNKIYDFFTDKEVENIEKVDSFKIMSSNELDIFLLKLKEKRLSILEADMFIF